MGEKREFEKRDLLPQLLSLLLISPITHSPQPLVYPCTCTRLGLLEGMRGFLQGSKGKVMFIALLGCLVVFLVLHFEEAGFTTMKGSMHDEVGKLRLRVTFLGQALERLKNGAHQGGTQQAKGGVATHDKRRGALSTPFVDTPYKEGDVYGDLAAAARSARTGGLCGVVHGNSEVPMTPGGKGSATDFLTLHAKRKRLFFVPVRAEDSYSDAEWDNARTGHFDEAYFIVYVVASNTHAGGQGLPPPRSGTMLVVW